MLARATPKFCDLEEQHTTHSYKDTLCLPRISTEYVYLQSRSKVAQQTAHVDDKLCYHSTTTISSIR